MVIEPALMRWNELVQDRWQLLDRFDADGRRTLKGRRTPPLHERRVERQLHALALRSRAWSLKQIAAELEISNGHVCDSIKHGLRRLGLRTQEELAALLCPLDPDTALRCAAPPGLEGGVTLEGGAELLTLSFPLPRWTMPESFSSTEAEVARLALSGLGNDEIAVTRRVSKRTVTNQIATVFRKARVHSRVELALRCRQH